MIWDITATVLMILLLMPLDAAKMNWDGWILATIFTIFYGVIIWRIWC